MSSLVLEQEVATLIVQTLKLKVDPSTIQPEAALFGDGLGLDSIDALELSLAIAQTMAIKSNPATRRSRRCFPLSGRSREPLKKIAPSDAGVMSNAPLIDLYGPDDALAWEADGPRSAGEFLSGVAELANSLPDSPSVLNLLSSRYEFLVGFAAAMMRGQVTLLPQSHAPQTLRRIADEHGECYGLTDRGDLVEGLPCVTLPFRRGRSDRSMRVPQIPLHQQVAVAFTSGSTGQPTPNRKTWGALVSVARDTASRFELKAGRGRAVVATVPHQHMFGLEASVMLPIQHGLAMHAGRPLFPEDVRTALEEVAGRSVLITTPLHLRACVMAGVKLPAHRDDSFGDLPVDKGACERSRGAFPCARERNLRLCRSWERGVTADGECG